MIIGINCKKSEVIIAETSGDREEFSIQKITIYPFDLKNAEDCTQLYNNLKALLAAMCEGKQAEIALLCCPSGSHGSSIEAIKAEAIVELTGDSLGILISYVKPQSLKGALGCTNVEKWQAKSKDLFNSNGFHKYWQKGSDGAVSAAYKISPKN